MPKQFDVEQPNLIDILTERCHVIFVPLEENGAFLNFESLTIKTELAKVMFLQDVIKLREVKFQNLKWKKSTNYFILLK